MAIDYFLKIDGVDGESADSKHRSEIDILSFSWGQVNAGNQGAGGGAGAGKVSVQDFHFVTTVSSASPVLMQAAATGRRFQKAVLTARKAGGGQQDFLKVTMSDLLISSYQIGGSAGGDVPIDQVSLSFSKIDMQYEKLRDGSVG